MLILNFRNFPARFQKRFLKKVFYHKREIKTWLTSSNIIFKLELSLPLYVPLTDLREQHYVNSVLNNWIWTGDWTLPSSAACRDVGREGESDEARLLDRLHLHVVHRRQTGGEPQHLHLPPLPPSSLGRRETKLVEQLLPCNKDLSKYDIDSSL